jgi:hypothetical protein
MTAGEADTLASAGRGGDARGRSIAVAANVSSRGPSARPPRFFTPPRLRFSEATPLPSNPPAPGAPLDNNICERALKMSIKHRKNSLFYKTQRGAQVGDIYMSLIHTCQNAQADPFDYLTQLQRHRARVIESPADWLPWNYRQQSAAGQ